MTTARLQRLFKAVQRRVLDFLLTKYGLALMITSFVVITVCVIQFADTLIEYRLTRLTSAIGIKNASILLSFATIGPGRNGRPNRVDFDADFDGLRDDDDEFGALRTNIDAVYTWVNGSDPEHIRTLNTFRFFYIFLIDFDPFISAQFL